MQPKKSINEKELETLKFWQDNKIFEKSLNSSAPSFTFYDGPPFATGLPHIGHILAGTIKDAIPRYQTMRGHRVRRVWGWDCHGLPIENMIEKELALNSKKEIEEYGVDKFNQAAADSVLRYEKEWKQIVPRLGRWVDMERPYKTMDATYTESVWWSWKTLYDKGLAYEGHKIMHICPRCETPLAQSEVGLEYHDVTDLSVTTRFELVDEPRTFILAWTTTPWTLPGNTALAVHRDIDYVKVRETATVQITNNGNYETPSLDNFIISKKSFLQNSQKINPALDNFIDEQYQYFGKLVRVVEEFKGEKLVGLEYKPLFNYFEEDLKNGKIVNGENAYKIWHADFITEDTGTGIAHEAPAFGTEDMELAKVNSIPVIKHVHMNGEFVSQVVESFSLKENKNAEEIIGTKEFSQGQNEESKILEGVKVKKKDDTMSTDVLIVRWLAENGKLFSKEKIVHSYPLCWRCKTPLLNYATSSWFVDVPKIKDKLISENSKVKWIPEHIRDGRFGKWLEGAREWAVSRRRYWGAPLPIWQSKDGKVKVIGSLAELAELNVNKPKNKYIVMRHGECISNTKNILDLKGDDSNFLTEKGKSIANDNRNKLKDQVDIIYTSPFLRAVETSNIISNGKVEVIQDERLKESDFGEWHGKIVNDFINWFNL